MFLSTEPGELAGVAWVLTRAFARDPCVNWLGSVKKWFLIITTNRTTTLILQRQAKLTLKELSPLQYCLVKGAILNGAFLTIAVISQRGW